MDSLNLLNEKRGHPELMSISPQGVPNRSYNRLFVRINVDLPVVANVNLATLTTSSNNRTDQNGLQCHVCTDCHPLPKSKYDSLTRLKRTLLLFTKKRNFQFNDDAERRARVQNKREKI